MKWRAGWVSMRVNAKGLHWTVATLADGTKRTYWYAWRGGPRLIGEYGSPEFIASYNAAIATRPAGLCRSTRRYGGRSAPPEKQTRS
jgi:hypothetical protein